MTKREELKKALKEGNLYDFISNEGRHFEKSELIDIIKNLDFAIYTLYGGDVCKDVENKTIETLNDYDFFKVEE